MNKLFLDRNSVNIKVRKTPFFPTGRSTYQLPDFSYGKWILFEGGTPKYYLDIFDDMYSGVVDKTRVNIESYLIKRFKEKGVNVKFTPNLWGFPVASRSEVVELVLRKLPLEFLA